MENPTGFNTLIQKAIVNNWQRDALTDYKGATLQYHDVARKIEKLHIMFESSGIAKGDKIALCGRNSAAWACAFLAIVTYGAVAVPVQHEFKPEQVYNVVDHSEARLLFVGDVVSTTLDYSRMPLLEGVVYLPDYSLVLSRTEKLTYAREHLNEMFGKKYPKYFRPEHVAYHQDKPEELIMVNYTSGTTGFSKGVMLPYRSIWSNLDYLQETIGQHMPPAARVLDILPMAHMYGLVCEFLLHFVLGNHLFFLTRLPSPTIIQAAFTDIHPHIITSVPLVVEKIIRKKVFPLLNNNRLRLLMKMPGISKKVKEHVLKTVMEFFGGQAFEVIVGGAGLNREIEDFLTSIHFPIAMAYGTTETGPLITFTNHDTFITGSCGKAVKHMEVRIASGPNEGSGVGELVTRGLNTMLGYYKNPQATEAVLDADGWFHTGDLARMDDEGHIFILGRIKNMLLGSNGQNVYPEEIEDKLNSMAMVNESLVIQRGDQIVALVYPDMHEAEALGFTQDDLKNIMEQNRKELNTQLPAFCKISEIRLQPKEFEKTAKKSIKRYLYKEA